MLHTFFRYLYVSNLCFYSEYVLGHQITLVSPLDAMLEEDQRFLGDVDDAVIRQFMLEMREMKRDLLCACIDSVKFIWEDYMRKVAQREADPSKLSLERAREQEAAVKVRLEKMLVDFVQQAEGESGPETSTPVDSICIAHHVRTLQQLLPGEIQKWGHERNPRSDETDLLSFCASGVRIHMIGGLSDQLHTLESKLRPPKATIAVSVHNDGTADYGQPTVDFDPSAVKTKTKTKTADFYSVSHVPLRAHGTRFIQWTKDACFQLLQLEDGVKDRWVKDNPTVPGESWKEMRERNRRSAWWRLFFVPEVIKPMERKGYLLSSFGCDGTLTLLLFICQLPTLLLFYTGVAVHFSFINMDATAIQNVQYELNSKSARKGECHKTWEDGVVSTDSPFGICKLLQIKPWEGVTWVDGIAEETDEEMRDADDIVFEELSDAGEMDVEEFSISQARSFAEARSIEACDVDYDMAETFAEAEGCSSELLGHVEAEDSDADIYGAFAEMRRVDWDMTTRFNQRRQVYACRA